MSAEGLHEEKCSRCGDLLSEHTRPKPCKYQGWSNYDTWCVALHIDNAEPELLEILEETQNAIVNVGKPNHFLELTSLTEKDHATYRLSKRLKELADENAPELDGIFADLLQAALGEVNWYELAEHYIEKYQEEEA